MTENRITDSASVYQSDEPAAHPRAFYVDVWDEDTDTMEHYYYGVTAPNGQGGIARRIGGGSFHSFRDPDTLADRIGGEVVWI
ncbi:MULTISPECIES: hypothetical protein [unclassified Nocardiopsis]|uniref:hypothetical protein n=1 Tax=Nocardiopsis TaxID=2013 RepID=UPI00387B8D1F